jgi:hypothetical protein
MSVDKSNAVDTRPQRNTHIKWWFRGQVPYVHQRATHCAEICLRLLITDKNTDTKHLVTIISSYVRLLQTHRLQLTTSHRPRPRPTKLLMSGTLEAEDSGLLWFDTVVGWLLPDVSKDGSAFIFSKKQFKKTRKALRSFETSGTTHPTQRHIIEDLNPQQHRCESPKCHQS